MSSSGRHLSVYAGALVAAAVLARVVPACLDVTPVYVPEREASAANGEPCLACLDEPNADGGCRDQIDVCLGNAKCAEVYRCVAANACFDLPTLDDKIFCTVPCLEDAGITTTGDPTVGVLVDVVKCGQSGCGVACNLGDAGIDLDAF